MIKTFENFTKVNFSDLEGNWNAEVAVNKQRGKYPYIREGGKWIQNDNFTGSEYHKVIFMSNIEADNLNTFLRKKLEADKEYEEELEKITKRSKDSQ